MSWYWVIFSGFVILAFLECFTNLSRRIINICCTVTVLIVVFLSSIRWNQTIGDWASYYRVFQRISIDQFSDLFHREVWDFEPLYNTISRIVKVVFDDYLGVQTIMAILAIGLFYKTVLLFNESDQVSNGYSCTKYNHVALILLLAWSTECLKLYTIRTSVATSICLYSIKFIEKKDFKRFIICIVFALGFHFSAIVFVPAYFIYHMRLDIKQVFRFVFGTVVLTIVGAPKLIQLVGLLGGRYANKAAGYNYELGEAYFNIYSFSGVFILIKGVANTLLVGAIALFVVSRLKKEEGAGPRVNGLANLYLFGAMMQIVLLPYNMLIARAAVFYISLQFFILPFLLRSVGKSATNRVIVFCGLVLYSGLKMFLLLRSSGEYLTFNNIFIR